MGACFGHGRRHHEAAARERRALRAPDPSLEPQDEALHLHRAQRHLHHRPAAVADLHRPRLRVRQGDRRPRRHRSCSSAPRSRRRKRSPSRRRASACPTSTSAGSAACSPTSRPCTSGCSASRSSSSIDFDDVAGIGHDEEGAARPQPREGQARAHPRRHPRHGPGAQRGVDRRHQEGAHRGRRGPQARHPGRRDPRHQLRPRRGRLQDPRQRRRDPLRRPAHPGRRRRCCRGPDGSRAGAARGDEKPATASSAATSRWPTGSGSSWQWRRSAGHAARPAAERRPERVADAGSPRPPAPRRPRPPPTAAPGETTAGRERLTRGRAPPRTRPRRREETQHGDFTAADVKKLRDATGAGMMDGKKALDEADGDFDKAVEILRDQGPAKGVAKRERAHRQQRPGRRCRGRDGTLVELSCETDFVAKGEPSRPSPASRRPRRCRRPATVEALLARRRGRPDRPASIVDEANADHRREARARARCRARRPRRRLPAPQGPDLPPQLGVLVEFDGDDAEVARDVASRSRHAPQYALPRRGPAEVDREGAPRRRGHGPRGGQAGGGDAARSSRAASTPSSRRRAGRAGLAQDPKQTSGGSRARPASTSPASPVSRSAQV